MTVATNNNTDWLHESAPLLSVVIPNKNSYPWSASLLESVLSQGCKLQVIIVDDGSTDASLPYFERQAELDSRITLLHGKGRGPGAARNLGLAHVRGDYLVFADSDDIVPPGAYIAMLSSALTTGSDLVIGKYQRHIGDETIVVHDSEMVHATKRTGLSASDSALEVWEPVLWNKLFRTSFWNSACGDMPEDINYEDQPPALAALLGAKSFDSIPDLVYSWRISDDKSSRSSSKNTLEDIESRLEMCRRVLALIERHTANSAFTEELVYKWVIRDFPMYFKHYWEKTEDDSYLTYLRQWALLIVQQCHKHSKVWARVPINQRLNLLVVAYGSYQQVLEYAATSVEQGKQLPYDYVTCEVSHDIRPDVAWLIQAATDKHPEFNALLLSDCDFEVVAAVREVTTLSKVATSLTVTAYVKNFNVLPSQNIAFVLADDQSEQELKFTEQESDHASWLARSPWWDYSSTTYEVEIPHALLRSLESPAQVIVRFTLAAGTSQQAVVQAPVLVTPETRHQAACPIQKVTEINSPLKLCKPTRLSLTRYLSEVRQGFKARIAKTTSHLVVDQFGQPTIKQVPAVVLVDTLAVEPDASLLGSSALVLHGRFTSKQAQPSRLTITLKNSARPVSAPATVDAAGNFTARVCLTELSPTNAYSLKWSSDKEPGKYYPVYASQDFHTAIIPGSQGSLDVRVRASEIVLFVREPHQLSLQTRWGQTRLPADRPVTDSILFESFEGKSVWDNPGALAHQLIEKQLLPDIPVYMSVQNVEQARELPSGVRPVLYGSDDWFRLLTTSKVLVTNNHLPHWFVKGENQYWLQTWHGTPIKKLLWDASPVNIGLVYRQLMRRQVPTWDILLAQNERGAELLSSSMGYEGNVLINEYPRNLRLAQKLSHRVELCQQLGLDPSRPIVLWAPTWRYNGNDIQLPIDEIISRYGHQVLVRGHHLSRLKLGAGVDVSSHQNIEDLLAISDVLITDYSSTAYDYQLTGRPIIFYVPDYDYYVGSDRGLYPGWPFNGSEKVYYSEEELLAADILSTLKGAAGGAQKPVKVSLDQVLSLITTQLQQK